MPTGWARRCGSRRRKDFRATKFSSPSTTSTIAGATKVRCGISAEGLGVITYFSLASGFLSGKYRSKADLSESARGELVAKYLDDRGLRILRALDSVARERDATQAEVALAWLMAREGVTAPIASATTLDQLESLIRATALKLSSEEVTCLTSASDYA
jgi:aryl-alcohol dehydrogenase-like predicted oxidoreductase